MEKFAERNVTVKIVTIAGAIWQREMMQSSNIWKGILTPLTLRSKLLNKKTLHRRVAIVSSQIVWKSIANVTVPKIIAKAAATVLLAKTRLLLRNMINSLLTLTSFLINANKKRGLQSLTYFQTAEMDSSLKKKTKWILIIDFDVTVAEKTNNFIKIDHLCY